MHLQIRHQPAARPDSRRNRAQSGFSEFQVLTRDYRRPLIIAGRWIPDGRIGETLEFDTGE
jgi:hypothetical protein